jgi:methylthioribose-1-phosphate isomerase
MAGQTSPSPLTSIRTHGSDVFEIEIIDQLLLPHTERWFPVTSPEDAYNAIKRMQIRGAPAIASLAALSVAAYISHALAVGANEKPGLWLESPDALRAHIRPILAHLATARPTAVNLGGAIARLNAVLDGDSGNAREIAQKLVAEGRAVADEDVGRNKLMGRHGADWLLARVKAQEGQERKLRVLTVCNTGGLATSVRCS